MGERDLRNREAIGGQDRTGSIVYMINIRGQRRTDG